MKVLITLGGTREPIDSVRFITNASTGRTGAFIADWLTEKGAIVTALCAESALIPFRAKRSLKFRSFQDLDDRLRETLQEDMYDVVIHSAAVSDFCVDRLELNGEKLNGYFAGKLPSTSQLSIHLKPTYKIVERIKGYARHRVPMLFAFKLTHSTNIAERDRAVGGLLESGHVNYVVHNDLMGMGTGNAHQFEVFGPGVKSVAQGSTKDELSQVIHRLMLAGRSR